VVGRHGKAATAVLWLVLEGFEGVRMVSEVRLAAHPLQKRCFSHPPRDLGYAKNSINRLYHLSVSQRKNCRFSFQDSSNNLWKKFHKQLIYKEKTRII